MCHQWSTRPDPQCLSPVANVVFTLFCFARSLKVGTDERTTCANTIIPTGRDFGLAEWIDFLSLIALGTEEVFNPRFSLLNFHSLQVYKSCELERKHFIFLFISGFNHSFTAIIIRGWHSKPNPMLLRLFQWTRLKYPCTFQMWNDFFEQFCSMIHQADPHTAGSDHLLCCPSIRTYTYVPNFQNHAKQHKSFLPSMLWVGLGIISS